MTKITSFKFRLAAAALCTLYTCREGRNAYCNTYWLFCTCLVHLVGRTDIQGCYEHAFAHKSFSIHFCTVLKYESATTPSVDIIVFSAGEGAREDCSAPQWPRLLGCCDGRWAHGTACSGNQHPTPVDRRRGQRCGCGSLSSVSCHQHDLWCQLGEHFSSLATAP